jgi:hypothetical protein
MKPHMHDNCSKKKTEKRSDILPFNMGLVWHHTMKTKSNEARNNAGHITKRNEEQIENHIHSL